MALVLQLLPLLLSRAQGNPGASLDGHPGDRVNLSCVGVSQPTRWVWAPRFPACKGLSKGRRAILLASPNGTPTVSPVQPFAGRLRALDLDIRRLELLLSAGDSGTFICKGRQENESRTELHVLGDRAYCRALGPTHALSPPHSSIRESGAPEASRGGRAQDCRGPGPGAEPALRRPGSYGPQKILPTVPSGPC
ncbi:megakaryocyte and platelet inhibitory receptor G6b isoform X4 [Monodon monoceros]|uniref:megakaryocyte and platelet inhibitory receptor G6b isoform X4 n=1 Tax=Monodon monoceros TaxID=40151 RepID=UPI0010F688AD|nr:megakaryocyte and platelet inhibitory receptor G6b isoform X4 [Monodon monoceros]